MTAPQWDERELDTVRKICELFAAKTEELAEFFGVETEVFETWLTANPELDRVIARGNLLADARVAERLHRRATGYTHRARKVIGETAQGEPVVAAVEEYHPPNLEAAKFWLCNRQPDHWRDVLKRGERPIIN